MSSLDATPGAPARLWAPPEAASSTSSPAPPRTAQLVDDDDDRSAEPLGFSVAPTGFGRRLDTSFAFIRNRLGLVAVLSLVITLPLELGAILLARHSNGSLEGALAGAVNHIDTATPTADTSLVAALGANLFEGLSVALMGLAVAVVAVDALEGRASTTLSVLRRVVRFVPAALVAWAVSRPAIAVASVFCVVPGIVVAVLFGLAMPVLVFERATPMRALARSRALASRRLVPIACLSLVAALLTMLAVASVSGIAAIYVQLGTSGAAPEWWWVVDVAARLLAGLMRAPVAASVALVSYLDCLCRLDGADIERDINRAFMAETP